MKMEFVTHFFYALRPKTLTAAFVPVLVGHGLTGFVGGDPQLWITLCCLASAFAIQIATNFLNDAIDFSKGADTESRVGPLRVTQSGLMTEKMVMTIGFLFLGAAAAFGAPLVMQGGLPIIGLGCVSLFLAYGYTGGPFPLAYLGLGDLFVILFFGVFAVLGTFYLQTLNWGWLAIGAGIQVGLLATVLIAINNLRDRNTDRLVGKKTLAVRFGARFSKLEICTLLVGAYGMNVIYGAHIEVWWTLVTLPLAGFIAWSVCKNGDSPEVLNRSLALSGALQLSFGVLLFGALAWT